eukprot:jgi/Mesvir1/18385/Mv14266-RA.2
MYATPALKKWMYDRVSEGLGVDKALCEVVIQHDHRQAELANAFLTADMSICTNHKKLFWFLNRPTGTAAAEPPSARAAKSKSPKSIIATTGASSTGRAPQAIHLPLLITNDASACPDLGPEPVCFYFIRLVGSTSKLLPDNVDNEVICGRIGPKLLEQLSCELQSGYLPVLRRAGAAAAPQLPNGSAPDAEKKDPPSQALNGDPSHAGIGRLVQDADSSTGGVSSPVPVIDGKEWDERPSRREARLEDATSRFVTSLQESLASLLGIVYLETGEALDRLVANLKEKRGETLGDTEAFIAIAKQTDFTKDLEALASRWCNQLERVLLSCHSVEPDHDARGPSTELEKWKALAARFESLVTQVNAPSTQQVLCVLDIAFSPLIPKWVELEKRLRDAANEAKECVKYLYSLERFLEPLYCGDPEQVTAGMEPLLKATLLLYSVSPTYGTNERMTTLLMKITNQMICCCKAYLKKNGSLWEDDHVSLLARFQVCLDMNAVYQQQYRGMLEQVTARMPRGKPFLSEAAVFGKFDAFCWRLSRLVDLFTTIKQYGPLRDSAIEGIQPLQERFNNMVALLQYRSYDLLDHRCQEFEADYAYFYEQVADIESGLCQFVAKSFGAIHSTERALSLLRQFQGLLRTGTLREYLMQQYNYVIDWYAADLDTVKDVYEAQKDNPPMPRNVPPVAGNIAWARQLLRKIEEPMKVFQANPAIVKLGNLKRVLKTYNRIASTIIEFELRWVHKFAEASESLQEGLFATLVVRHPETHELHVNLDRAVLQMIREARMLAHMGVALPGAALRVAQQEDKFQATGDRLGHMLGVYNQLMRKKERVYSSLLRYHLEKLERKVEPGLTSITWKSPKVEEYLVDLDAALRWLSELTDKVDDIMDNRILAPCRKLANHQLLKFVHNSSNSIEAFRSATEAALAAAAPALDYINQGVETAVQDLLHAIMLTYSQQEVASLRNNVEDLKAYFEKRFFLSCCKTVKVCVNDFRLNIQAASISNTPLFRVSLHLNAPAIVCSPSVADIEANIVAMGVAILRVAKEVKRWGQDRTLPRHQLHDYYAKVTANRGMLKNILLLVGSITFLRKRLQDYMLEYSQDAYLWEESKQAAYESFLQGNPTQELFESRIQHYVQVEAEIRAMPDEWALQCLNLDLRPLKSALLQEAAGWKAMFARELNAQARTSLLALVTFVADTEARLAHEVADLEDVRLVMEALEQLRGREAEVELGMVPIENAYTLLTSYQVPVSAEELEMVDQLPYAWQQLRDRAAKKFDKLIQVSPGLRRQLKANVAAFVKDVEKFKREYDNRGPMVKGLKPRVAIERLREFQRGLEERERRWRSYEKGEALFHLPTTQYPELVSIRKELKSLANLYNLYLRVLNSRADYLETLWTDVDMETLSAQVSDWQAGVRKLPQLLRQWDAYCELKKMVDDFQEILPLLFMFKNAAIRERHWANVTSITGHVFGVHPIRDADVFKLRHFLEAPLQQHRMDLEEMSCSAAKEAEIESKLDKIKGEWVYVAFSFTSFKNRADALVLHSRETQKLIAQLEDSQMSLGSLMSNRHNGPFKKEISEWVRRLATVGEVVEQWMAVQAMWMYMEVVFTGGDIAKQMPAETKKFAQINKAWIKMMQSCADSPNVIKVCVTDESVSNLLPHLAGRLESCQRSLRGYLERKRSLFPRFFFVSNPVLLEMLGQGSNAAAVQVHLSSVFDNIAAVELSEGREPQIIAMVSREGETVPLSRRVPLEGNIEDWLGRLEGSMKATLRMVMRNAAEKMAGMSLDTFVVAYPAQVTIFGLLLMWTLDSETALRASREDKSAMKAADGKVAATLRELVDMASSPTLCGRDRIKVETLVTVQVHQRDVFHSLLLSKTRSQYEFDWQKQTRVYWSVDQDTCIVGVTDVELEYCYEFLGCTERLVITPLTDRVYITLCQALGLYLGGSPAGPAGTGKTETVKDLGRTLGKFVVVVNCSDQMDFRSMGKYFKGLAQSGAWGCFDEFNRIELEVLSVVAQQLQCVFNALRDHRHSFTFTDGQELGLHAGVGFFVTMNPGYAGRQELPENLKSLFRGVAMMVPERQIIMRVKLAAAGFQESVVLARKFHALYQLAEQQLSAQRHYDFGLRNVLSVLRSCGPARRGMRDALGATPAGSGAGNGGGSGGGGNRGGSGGGGEGSTAGSSANAVQEGQLFMRVVRDANLSKLVDEDEPLFLSLLKDLFPGESVRGNGCPPDLDRCIRAEVSSAQLSPHPGWLAKLVQLHESALVRWGVMMLGPSSAGKSAAARVYLKAMTRSTGIRHSLVRLNPKAVTTQQLFGRLDPVTNDWADGVFSTLWRKACRKASESAAPGAGAAGGGSGAGKTGTLTGGSLGGLAAECVWICLDGPVDTLWIENLNSVLDDNRVLTLANGDRIPMAPTMKLLFEVADLANASPATVSRAGIIHMSSATLGWRPVLDAWLMRQRAGAGGSSSNLMDTGKGGTAGAVVAASGSGGGMTAEAASELKRLFGDHTDMVLALIEDRCHPAVHVEPGNRIMSCLTLLSALILPPSATNSFLRGPLNLNPGTATSATNAGGATNSGGGGNASSATGTATVPATQVAIPSGGGGSGHHKILSLAHVERLFTFALVWGFCGLLPVADRVHLDAYLRTTSLNLPPACRQPASGSAQQGTPEGAGAAKQLADASGGDAAGPPRPKPAGLDTIFSFYIRPDGQWEHWEAMVPSWVYPAHVTPAFSSIFVPTVDSSAYAYLISLAALGGRGVILTGGSGCAKTVTIRNYMHALVHGPSAAHGGGVPTSGGVVEGGVAGAAGLPTIGGASGAEQDGMESEKVLSKVINFSSMTTAETFQRTLESCVEKRMGTTYGPPGGKYMVVFVDDVNMPAVNEWGDQETLELLRWVVEDGGFYSLERPGEFKQVDDLYFLAAMSNPGAGHNPIPGRLKGHFLMFSMPMPCANLMSRIYRTIVEGHFCPQRSFSADVCNTASGLVAATWQLWNATKERLLPTPTKFHYVFNLRDVSRITQGLLQGSADVINSESRLVGLWRHECTRVMGDRLSVTADISWFQRQLDDVANKHFGRLVTAHAREESIAFVDYLRPVESGEEEGEEGDATKHKIYTPVLDLEELRERTESLLASYNEQARSHRLSLVLFEDALLHLARITRVLAMPRGSVLLIGVGGSGRQSLARLASFIAGHRTVQLALTAEYNMTAFLDDVRAIYREAGMGKPVTFLVTDNDIKVGHCG